MKRIQKVQNEIARYRCRVDGGVEEYVLTDSALKFSCSRRLGTDFDGEIDLTMLSGRVIEYRQPRAEFKLGGGIILVSVIAWNSFPDLIVVNRVDEWRLIAGVGAVIGLLLLLAARHKKIGTTFLRDDGQGLINCWQDYRPSPEYGEFIAAVKKKIEICRGLKHNSGD